ncbi:WAT1-related protein At1g09380-like [Lolium rigidum]|uniref:WAT1-related protein At1g09380-like n=1 Tax=Lolium rigidum TaxID=89674 RepID=UPI001F5C8FA3|nr:WAT1-related protein At1g09380-like [Lolium rigidum]
MGLMPTVAMLLVQIGFAGNNLLSKMALDNGASPYVLISCRSLIAALFLAPFAVYFERNKWMMITKKVIMQILLSSTLGMAVSEVLFFVGFKYTSPTIACAIGNIVPALTFVIAATLKMEPVRVQTPAGQAKVVGTLVCVGGSMIMPFYKGPLLKLWASPIHWRYAEHTTGAAAPPTNSGLGDLLIILSAVAWAAWLIMQNKTSEDFSAPYTSTTIMSLIVSAESAGVSAAVDRSLSVWNIGLGINLYSVLYMGIVGWGIMFVVMTWCIQVRGPLFVSMFNPVVLVAVALLGWAILDEKLHVGSVIGSALIVSGLYMVLWGKASEMSRLAQRDGQTETVSTKELESNGKNNDVHSSPV